LFNPSVAMVFFKSARLDFRNLTPQTQYAKLTTVDSETGAIEQRVSSAMCH